MNAKIKKAFAAVETAVKHANMLTANMPDESGLVMLSLYVLKEGGVAYYRMGEIQLCTAALMSVARVDPKLKAAIIYAAAHI